MITRVEILIMNETPPEAYDGTYPQIICSAHPDMSNKAWATLGLALIHLVKNINQVDLDKIMEDLNEDGQ